MRKIILGIIFLLLVSVNGAYAQTNSEEVSITDGEAIVVADVRITDVVFVEDGGIIRGTFTLTNLIGIQTGITYGVTAQDTEFRIVDSLPLGRTSLKEGESVQVNFTYETPKNVGGEVLFMLVAKTAKGLPLSVQPLLSRNLPIVNDPTLSCDVSGDSTKITCFSVSGTTADISFFKGSEFGIPFKYQQFYLPAGVITSVELPKEAGLYRVFVRDLVSPSLFTTNLRVEGVHGEILNVVASFGENNALEGVAAVQASPLAGSYITVSLLDGGLVCDSKEYQLTDTTLAWSFLPNCSGGEVLVSLIGEEKTLLAETKVPLSEEYIIDEDSPIQATKLDQTACCNYSTKDTVAIFVLISLFILIAYYLVGLLKKDNRPVVPTLGFMFILGLGLYAAPVEAVTLNASAFGSGGEIGYSVWVTITPNKSAYVAGETMVITASANVNTDAGANGVTLTDANTAYNVDVSGVRWNNPVMTGGPVLVDPSPLNIGNFSSAGPFIGSSLPINIPGTLPFGLNYIRTRMNFDTSMTLPIQREGNMTFIVSTACTVQTSIGGTQTTYVAGDPDFDDFWMLFNDPNKQFLGSGFAADIRYRACGINGTGCGSPYSKVVDAPATIRPTIPAACATYARQCADGIDNDGDGLIDTSDPGCHTDGNAGNSASYTPTDNTESNGVPSVELWFTP